MQRHKGPTPRCLLFALPICSPPSRKSRHPGIGTGEAKHHEIGMQLLHCSLLLARLCGFGLQPACKLLRKGINLALSLWRREFWLDSVRRQMLGHGIP